MITTTLDNEKIIFKYIVNKKLFDYDDCMFSNTDIKKMYQCIVEHYNHYVVMPISSIISDTTNINISIVNQAMNFEQLDTVNDQWIVDVLTKHYREALIEKTIHQLVDDNRNGNYDKILETINIDIPDNKQKFEEFDYKNSTVEEVRRYQNKLHTSPVEDVIDEVAEVYDPNKTYQVKDYLVYPIIRQGQLVSIFGSTGHGKSIFCVEIANMIANGKSDWDEPFRIDTEAQPVLYLDFELGASSFATRYKKDKFSKNLQILNINVQKYNSVIGLDSKSSQRIDKSLEIIMNLVKKHKSKVIFIDNLSNIADNVEQAAEANRFIADLYGRMLAYDLTVVLIAHTPKVQNESKLNINHMKGSSSLTAVIENIIGFKRSNTKNISYIKQLKTRNVETLFADDEVAKLDFNAHGKNGWEMNFVGTEDEDELLMVKKGKGVKIDLDTKLEILYKLKVKNVSKYKLAKEYDISRSSILNFETELLNNLDLQETYKMYVHNNKRRPGINIRDL